MKEGIKALCLHTRQWFSGCLSAGHPGTFSCHDNPPTELCALSHVSDRLQRSCLTCHCPFPALSPGALHLHPRGPRRAPPQRPQLLQCPRPPRRPPPPHRRRRTQRCPHTCCSPTASASWRSLGGRKSGSSGRTNTSGRGSLVTSGCASRTGELRGRGCRELGLSLASLPQSHPGSDALCHPQGRL